ncbi:MAG TPA: carboxypeptidase regulatory-like domain-containing protein [Vicinamibacterales bacterium]|nr:carboxypeptidase regulatory-like domain-containing protein [Vicinamibacterales bacterium]
MKAFTKGVLALVVATAFATSAFAQGGGASSTGTIQGRVSDAQGAVLPGVTVTATSPALIQPQTTVTSETGNYRFPAVPPGTYELTYELAGFNALKRSGISITLGFTANVNVELALATLQETVTVSGASPVIDTSTTRVQQNFKLDQLQSIPNGRDMWALLAVTPSVQMARIDVGGNRAGTQTGYTAYGMTGQVRVLIEGINTTEGTGGAGFYFDYASLEEAFLGTSGQSAEMPNPGVQSQFIARSGSNQFQGEYHLDWYNNSLQGSNIPDSYTAPTAFNNSPIRKHSNEIAKYYDHDINVGGPIKKDKAWIFGTYREQFNAVAQPQFTFDKTFDTKLWNPVVKATYQLNQKNKLIGYYQWGQKEQPNRLPFAAYTYTDPSQTFLQDSGSWVYKGEWNSTISDKFYLEARYGDFGYYFPLIANSDANFSWRDSGRAVVEGANQIWQLDRDRKQYNLAGTYFLDTGMGSHTFKMGAELLKERSWEGYLQQYGGNIDHVYTNGVSNTVTFTFPTATDAGKLSAHDKLTSKAALNHTGAFINDTWSLGRATVNAGLRWDRYVGLTPEQEQLPGSLAQWAPQFPSLAALVTAKTFPEKTYFTWNVAAPRIGVTFDLSGDGRTVLKGNYGLYWHNPGAGVGGTGNPNTASKFATYTWNDINGDRRWQPGEQGASPTSIALEGATGVDPNIKTPYTHEASGWIERQLTDTMGVRAGFVYKTEDDLFATMQPLRPASLFTVPYSFTDIGVDGRAGTSDDRTLTFYGIPNTSLPPASSVVMTVDQFARYKTFETSMNKRYGSKWSGQLGFGYTMISDFPNGPKRTPNNPGLEDRSLWNFKASGSYDAPYGIRISPVLRHQSGSNYARVITVTAPAALGLTAISNCPSTVNNCGSQAYAEPMNANREDNIWVFDVRAEKNFTFGSRVRLRAYFDAFNLTNSHASEAISRATGLSYQKPSAILAPRTGRVGFRFIF